MAPKIKISNEDILTAAVQLIREHGVEALNARTLAHQLGCSVQPIFRTFGSMEDLKEAVYKRIETIYNTTMLESMQNDTSGNAFGAMGIAYINFAKHEKNMFKLLFMTDQFKGGSAMDIAGSTEGDNEVIAVIKHATGLDADRAKRLYTGIWFTTHGIASLLATNSTTLNDEEINTLLNQSFNGLIYVLKREMEEK